MPWFDDWNFGAEEDPTYRRNAVEKRLLAPLGLSFTTKTVIGARPEDPAIEQARARQTQARLQQHDALFGLDGGLVGSLERVSRPRYDVGDPEGRDD